MSDDIPANEETLGDVDFDIQCEEFYHEEYSIEELYTFSDGNYIPIYKNYTS